MNTFPAAVAIYGRNMKKLTRVPLLIFFSLFQPLLFLVLFSQTFREMSKLPGFPTSSYLAFLAPSIVMLTALNSAFQSGIGTVDDLESGFLDKMLTAPIPKRAIILGKAMADGTRLGVQALMIIGISYLMGFRMETGVGGVLLTLVVAGAFGIAWSGLSNIVALATGNSEITMILGIVITFPVLFLSNALMPPALLPDWLQTVAKFNPASYVIDALRALANTGYDWGEIGEAAAITALVAAITFTGAARLYKRVAV